MEIETLKGAKKKCENELKGALMRATHRGESLHN
jgi:hypothetical protein